MISYDFIWQFWRSDNSDDYSKTERSGEALRSLVQMLLFVGLLVVATSLLGITATQGFQLCSWLWVYLTVSDCVLWSCEHVVNYCEPVFLKCRNEMFQRRKAQVYGCNLRLRFCELRGSHVDDVDANSAKNLCDSATDGTPSRDLKETEIHWDLQKGWTWRTSPHLPTKRRQFGKEWKRSGTTIDIEREREKKIS